MGQADIKNPRFIAGFWVQYLHRLSCYSFRHDAVRIIQITKLTRTTDTGFHAGRQQPLIDAL